MKTYIRKELIIETDVSDNEGVSSVELYLDDSLIGNANTEPFQWEWNTNEVTVGEHSLHCKAVDNSDNETQSESILSEVTNPYPLPTESFSMVKNYNNKLLSIGFIDLISDALYFYERQDPIL